MYTLLPSDQWFVIFVEVLPHCQYALLFVPASFLLVSNQSELLLDSRLLSEQQPLPSVWGTSALEHWA